MSGTAIVFTATSRCDYMREVLASWSLVRGVHGARMCFHVEPGYPEMAEVCGTARGSSVHVKVNKERMGVQRNPFEAINCGFRDGADFVILAEDDIVVSSDVLEYFSWANKRYRDDRTVLAVTSSRHRSAPGGQAAVYLERSFHGWVWGIWRDRWEQKVAPDWTFNYEHNGWDWRLNEYWAQERGMLVVTPAESRSQHIGEFGGTHMPPSQHLEIQSDCFVQDIPCQSYLEVK